MPGFRGKYFEFVHALICYIFATMYINSHVIIALIKMHILFFIHAYLESTSKECMACVVTSSVVLEKAARSRKCDFSHVIERN